MAYLLELDLVTQTLVLSALALLISSIVLIMYRLLRARSSAASGSDMYLGGEHESILEKPLPSTAALYWATIKKSFANAYRILVESIHTGRLSDWAKYMSLWYGFLLLVGILIAVISVLGVR